MRFRGSRIVHALIVLALAGCASGEPPPRYPEITFKHLPPIKLDVAEIVYAPRYRMPVAAPNVAHEFPVPPAAAAERWIADRLVAVGSQGRATVTIRQATATENKLAVKKGISGAFTTDQAWRYDAVIEMAVDAVDPGKKLKAQASATARQSRTVPEDASLSEREDVWFALTEKLMRKFDETFEAQIRKDLGKFVR